MKWKIIQITALALAVSTAALYAQTLNTIHYFGGGDRGPVGGLALSGNLLYGTIDSGGVYPNYGTVFSIHTDGSGYIPLTNFGGSTIGPNGPNGSLVVTNGALYGTSSGGGTYGYGTVYSLCTNGNFLTVLFSFSNNPDGAYPGRSLTLVGDMLYGVTSRGGSNDDGTVFSIDTNGNNYAVLHQFAGDRDGGSPESGLVISDGKVYGTTVLGGTNNWGTVYSMNIDGSNYAVLYNFASGSDGSHPLGGLILSSNRLYGTTSEAGDNEEGTIFSINTDGSNFKSVSFPEGDSNSGLDQPDNTGKLFLSGSILYGVTYAPTCCGAFIYSLYTNGSVFTVLHKFSYADADCSCADSDNLDGALPLGVIPIISSNILYGTTLAGGTNLGSGTVFGLQLPVPPPDMSDIVVNTNNNTVTITCLGGVGYTYYTQATTNLSGAPAPWVNISTNVVDAGGSWQVTDSMTNGIFSYWQTNLVYSVSTNKTGPGGAALDSSTIIGTNIVEVTQDMRFYRAVSAQ